MANNTKTAELATKDEAVVMVTPANASEFANQLKEIIVKSNLFTNLKGKSYVNVEGWQIAGAFLGIEPMVESVENISDGNIIRYRAEVSLTDVKTGRKCGYGVAICTNREPGKQNFPEYAVASMAQTRAVGKAYRIRLGWLLKLAGYETTPSEEMDAIVDNQQDSEPDIPRNKPWEKYQNKDGKPTDKQLGFIKSLLNQGGASKEDSEKYLEKITTFNEASKAIEQLKARLEKKSVDETAPMPSDEELSEIDFSEVEEEKQ